MPRIQNGTKKGLPCLVILCALSVGGLSSALSAQSERTSQPGKTSTELLLNANSLIGNTVVDNRGKELGTVKDLLIDQQSGTINFIILSYGGTFGGTLGINAENFSIPWKQVTLIKRDEELVVEVADVVLQETQLSNRSETDPRERARTTHTPKFDSAAVETLEGSVTQVEKEMFEGGTGPTESLVVLEVQTPSGQQRVWVAPEDYLQQQGIDLKEGEDVKITGSRVTKDGELVIVASKVTLKKNGKEVGLRQPDGTPQWQQDQEIQTKSKSQH
jgi:sporulation protein YlmC with PRC-barrel domain